MAHKIDIKCLKFRRRSPKLDKVFQFMGLTVQKKLVNVQAQQPQEKFRLALQLVNEKYELSSMQKNFNLFFDNTDCKLTKLYLKK